MVRHYHDIVALLIRSRALFQLNHCDLRDMNSRSQRYTCGMLAMLYVPPSKASSRIKVLTIVTISAIWRPSWQPLS